MLWRFVVFLIMPLVLAGGLFIKALFLDSLPAVSGGLPLKVELGESGGRVEVWQGRAGIAHIKADSESTAYFATGFLHARDRLWQLEVQKRIAQGRLSEIFGQGALQQDIWFRTLGLYPLAAEAFESLGPEARRSLKDYARGINSYLKKVEDLPAEFRLHGIEPKPWTVEDSLAWSKVFAFGLSGDYQMEYSKYLGAQILDPRQLLTFFPDPKPVSATLSSQASEPVNVLGELIQLNLSLEDRLGLGGKNAGSNAWVVAGHLTRTGLPMLANDPHLGLQIPSVWYALKQEGGRLNVSGMSLVGLPIVIFGKNQNVAWGGTSMHADVQDLVFEHLDISDPTKYQYQNSLRKFISKEEVIKVRADFPAALRPRFEPVKINVRRSINGPIISDLFTGAKQTVALKWPGFDSLDTSYEAFFGFSYANDWAEFQKSASKLHVPAMNLFYADTNNNIGFHGVGKIPVRKKGYGDLPVNGAEDSDWWTTYIPFDELPSEFNPPRGYIVNANNDNRPEAYPYHISNEFALPYRAQRIDDRLESIIASGVKPGFEEMLQIQGDVVDLAVKSLQHHVVQSLPEKEYREYTELLAGWNGSADQASSAASLYYGIERALRKNLFEDELTQYWGASYGDAYLRSLGSRVSASAMAVLLADESDWCDDISTADVETCSVIVEQSVDQAIKELKKLQGSDPDDWRWGQVHKSQYQHIPFSNVKVLDRFFERRVSSGGSPNTVNVAGSQFVEGEGYLQNFGAGFRQIVEFGPSAASHYIVNSTGQSGQLGSKHYDDMLEDFAELQFHQFKDNTEALSLSLVLTQANKGESE